jgi:hypothetical protein
MYELESRIKSIRQREMDKLSPSVKVTTLGEGGEYRAFIPLVSTPPLSWDFAIDLSRWNIPICWRGIESHIQDGKKISRAIVKASEGTMTSYYVTEYWDWVDRANIPVTAYAFWRRYGGTAKAQADWFLKRAIKSPVSPWLDIEDTPCPRRTMQHTLCNLTNGVIELNRRGECPRPSIQVHGIGIPGFITSRICCQPDL